MRTPSQKARLRWLLVGILLLVVLCGLLLVASCGDGKECECCDSDLDCDFPLQCVEVSGGSGKACADVGVTYCYDISC